MSARGEAQFRVLETLLDAGEGVVARGAASEGHTSGRDYVLITSRRILWSDSKPERAGSLEFDAIIAWGGRLQGHRYTLVLERRPVTRLQWVPGKHFLWWSWDNAEGMVTTTRTTFRFSHRDTKAAIALREVLGRRGLASTLVLPAPRPPVPRPRPVMYATLARRRFRLWPRRPPRGRYTYRRGDTG